MSSILLRTTSSKGFVLNQERSGGGDRGKLQAKSTSTRYKSMYPFFFLDNYSEKSHSHIFWTREKAHTHIFWRREKAHFQRIIGSKKIIIHSLLSL
jgi:hypothetical protein